jgi:hypothetical protein
MLPVSTGVKATFQKPARLVGNLAESKRAIQHDGAKKQKKERAYGERELVLVTIGTHFDEGNLSVPRQK